jgi:hypothetical protein
VLHAALAQVPELAHQGVPRVPDERERERPPLLAPELGREHKLGRAAVRREHLQRGVVVDLQHALPLLQPLGGVQLARVDQPGLGRPAGVRHGELELARVPLQHDCQCGAPRLGNFDEENVARECGRARRGEAEGKRMVRGDFRSRRLVLARIVRGRRAQSGLRRAHRIRVRRNAEREEEERERAQHDDLGEEGATRCGGCCREGHRARRQMVLFWHSVVGLVGKSPFRSSLPIYLPTSTAQALVRLGGRRGAGSVARARIAPSSGAPGISAANLCGLQGLGP